MATFISCSTRLLVSFTSFILNKRNASSGYQFISKSSTITEISNWALNQAIKIKPLSKCVTYVSADLTTQFGQNKLYIYIDKEWIKYSVILN